MGNVGVNGKMKANRVKRPGNVPRMRRKANEKMRVGAGEGLHHRGTETLGEEQELGAGISPWLCASVVNAWAAEHDHEHDHEQEHGEMRSSTWVLEPGCQGWAAAPDFGAKPAKNPAPVRARG